MDITCDPNQCTEKIMIFVKWLSWTSHLYFLTLGNYLHVYLTTTSHYKSWLLTDKYLSSLQSSKWFISSPVSSEQNARLYKNCFWGAQRSFLLSFFFFSLNTLDYENETNKVQTNVLMHIFLLLYSICMLKLYNPYTSSKRCVQSRIRIK